MRRFEELLGTYLDSSDIVKTGLPTVAWFADKLHLSANYFGDLVKREMGISAQEYIQRYIIERAKLLLTDGRMTVSQTAYALGYKYPNHLSRVFKRVTGITPNGKALLVNYPAKGLDLTGSLSERFPRMPSKMVFLS